MKRVLFSVVLLLILLPLSGCKSGAYHHNLSGVTRAEIILYGLRNGELTSTYKAITFDKPAEIKKLSGYLSTTKSLRYKCGYMGDLKLYKKDKKVLDVSYNLNPQCAHGVYSQGGKNHFFKLTPAGAKALLEHYKALPVADLHPGIKAALKIH